MAKTPTSAKTTTDAKVGYNQKTGKKVYIDAGVAWPSGYGPSKPTTSGDDAEIT